MTVDGAAPSAGGTNPQIRRSQVIDWIAVLILLVAGYMYGRHVEVRCIDNPCSVDWAGDPIIRRLLWGDFTGVYLILALVAVFRPARFIRLAAAVGLTAVGALVAFEALTSPYWPGFAGSPYEDYWRFGAALACSGLWVVVRDSRRTHGPYAWMTFGSLSCLALGSYTLLWLGLGVAWTWGPEGGLNFVLQAALLAAIMTPLALWPWGWPGLRRAAATVVAILAAALLFAGRPILYVPAVLLLAGSAFVWGATRQRIRKIASPGSVEPRDPDRWTGMGTRVSGTDDSNG